MSTVELRSSMSESTFELLASQRSNRKCTIFGSGRVCPTTHSGYLCRRGNDETIAQSETDCVNARKNEKWVATFQANSLVHCRESCAQQEVAFISRWRL